MGRREDGAFILRVDRAILYRMHSDGWTITPDGPYAVAICPPPPVPDIPNHVLQAALKE